MAQAGPDPTSSLDHSSTPSRKYQPVNPTISSIYHYQVNANPTPK